MLKMRKKAPFQVLFCGLLQILASPGIDSACRNWYLT
ncbi:transcriptional regulator [Escherichia coli]|nr:transcriptional regulator [Escherichia coli O10]EFN7662792.1 transcriptional regulator [Escherichia coli]PSZ15260.1 transcriptional regulator [Escherichia sp. 4726-5]PTN27762.1 transcriptional regulator [Escherichia sp. MOD1-EC6475]EFN7882395.1 transcriptional regulator [Escherichia coli]